jgi:hypothetical protein
MNIHAQMIRRNTIESFVFPREQTLIESIIVLPSFPDNNLPDALYKSFFSGDHGVDQNGGKTPGRGIDVVHIYWELN